MTKTYNVTSASQQLLKAQGRVYRQSKGKMSQRHSYLSEACLRGNLEHFSHEAAVNRYMTATARRNNVRANLVFFVIVTLSILLGAAITLSSFVTN